MSTSTWIKLNLPIGTPISSPSSLSDISSTDFIPSSCLPENEGNLKASLLITDANLQLSPTPPDIPVALSSHRHQSTVLSTLSSTTHHVHQLTPSTLSTISPRIASNPDQAVLPEVEHWSSVQVPRVRSRGSSISSMGPSVHAHTSCRSTLLEEFRRQAECERLCNQLGNHLWNPDRHSYGYSDGKPLISNPSLPRTFPRHRLHPCPEILAQFQFLFPFSVTVLIRRFSPSDNAHNHSHTTGLPARTLPPSDLPSSSSSSLHVLTHRSSLVRVPPVNSSLGPLRPVSPPSTWGRQQHLIGIDGNPYSGAMFRRAPRPSSLTSTADQSPSGRPRSKLRKSHRPFLVLTPPGSFDSTNAFTTPTPASILPDSKVIDLTDLTSTISHINSTTPSGRVTINQQHESMASRPNRRPLNVTYPSHSTDGSCTSGSSTTTSAHTSSFSASTAPTSPSLMSEHHKSYPPLHSSLSDPLRVSSSRNLDEHPLPPLPAEVHQNATRILPNTAGRPNSQLSPKHNPSRKLTKRRAPSGSFNAILDRPLPPTPITADTADSEPKSDHPPTRRSRSILGIRIPMGTESSKKRSMRDHAEPRPHSLPFEPHGPLWTGTKSVSRSLFIDHLRALGFNHHLGLIITLLLDFT